MWSHLVHLGVCAQLQVDDVETWLDHYCRIFEILALSVVYASTIFVTAFMLLSIASNMMGLRTLKGYLTALCAAIWGS